MRFLLWVVVAVIVLAGFSADLAVAAPKPRVVCNVPGQQLIPVARIKPRVCLMLDESQAHAEGHNYAKLRWPHWGTRRAYFRGISRGFHLPYARIKVRGFFFRPRADQCGGRHRVYTRMFFRTKYGRFTERFDPCVGEAP